MQPLNGVMLRELGAGEAVLFSRRSPLGFETFNHVLQANNRLEFIHTIPSLPSETDIPIPMAAGIWLVEGMVALLKSKAAGGVDDSSWALNHEEPGCLLRLRRSLCVESPTDPGYTLFDRNKPNHLGFPSISWSDRLLFDCGLFAKLYETLTAWSRNSGAKPPREEWRQFRP